MERTALIIALLLNGLMAGLFLAWSCSVMPGLGRLPDHAYLQCMKAMNRAILNPVFFVIFFGSPLSLLVCSWQQSRTMGVTEAVWVLAAALVQSAGVMGVTVIGNIPLNNALEATDLSVAGTEEMQRLRAAFDGDWVRLNHIRSAASLVAFALLMLHGLRSWRSFSNIAGTL